MYYADGSKYAGLFENDQFQGFGVYTYPSASTALRYEGEWKENQRHGFGSTFFKDGSTYVGQVLVLT